MEFTRRRMLFGLGAAAGVSGGVLGTGALTTISTDRVIDIDVEGDSSAFLGLYDTSSGNFVDTSGGAIRVRLNDNVGGTGTGVNHGSSAGDVATTTLSPAFTIKNQGADKLYVQISHSGNSNSGNDVQFIADDRGNGSGDQDQSTDVISDGNNLAFIDRTAHTTSDAVTLDLHEGGNTTDIDHAGYLNVASSEAVDVCIQVASDTTTTGDIISSASILASGDTSGLSGSEI